MNSCQWHEDGTSPIAAKRFSCFVFGSNLNGHHCGGAARFAKEFFGAVEGLCAGYSTDYRSYAIVTLDTEHNKMPIEMIEIQVNEFFREASMSHLNFFITRIGCGIAGFKDEQIAPMFKQFAQLNNISLPEPWRKYIL